ncbi:glycoside hydrolase family 43 protein [Stakelama marina]|uniref:Glycoside hydrolase 43 family protein n=1 Tax=Stakelama marina TaxID=2826939 RepID=A0A8T4IDT6_9SPHN|nr:glycoside hydrolase 43 family protein [Stakelama marina]MBR0552807.1 glycoside hydrolase 43 family protein [Stakelama marina]
MNYGQEFWRVSAIALAIFAGVPATAAQVWQSDQGDGSYRNPVLYADYPDPDIIRVGSDFYFVTTTFADVPGITILHSKDLINWTIASHVVPRLDDTKRYDLKNGGAYRKGLFAASLRHHGGMFYLAVTPVGQNTRIYYSRDIRGPWRYHELDRAAFDPGLFIDDDGSAYIATSYNADGTITLLTLDKTLSHVTGARKIHYIKGAEGSKIIKRKGWYYLFNAIPPRLGLTVSRARNLFGPWETRNEIDDRTGGHQGALVDLPNGGWFGFVMRDSGAIGRMTNMSPVFWRDGWPIWGTPDAPNRVPDHAEKPIKGFPLAQPAASDDFSRPRLGLQWQWNHNPDDSRWSLTERPGFLRLRPTVANQLWTARNTLVQKGQGPRSTGTVKLDTSHVERGDRCGFGTFGQYSAQLTVSRDRDGQATLSTALTEDTEAGPKTNVDATARPVPGNNLWLRASLDFKTDRGRFSYSTDGQRWTRIGTPFPLAFAWRTGTFQGEQFALFCYNRSQSSGYLDIDSFTLTPGG